MNDYPSNSNRFKEAQIEKKEEPKKIEKVITGTAKVKKKNGVQKFTDVFIAEDMTKVRNYFIYEILIPNIKRTLSTVLKEGVDNLFGTFKNSNGTTRADKISYDRFYPDPRYSDRPYTPDSTPKRVYSYDKVIIDTRDEAQEVLTRMDEMMAQYHSISVAEFYSLVGVDNYDFTAHDFGWKDIRSAEILKVSDGYLIKLPKAGPLNN